MRAHRGNVYRFVALAVAKRGKTVYTLYVRL